jgi:hypothetical protein
VIYQNADGEVYVNRARDLHYKEPEVWTKIGENHLVNQKGERLRIPPWPGTTRPGQPRQEPGCAAGQGTGAYFRIHSQPGELPAISPVYRFAFASAYVRLPKWQEEISYNPAKEGLYYMLGGWGNPDLSANHKGHRQAVDAGIFFNTDANNWAMFIKVEGMRSNQDWVKGPVRIKSEQPAEMKQRIKMEFSVPEENLLRLRVFGALEDGSNVSVPIDARADDWWPGYNPGWRSNGTGNILKQETTIAQEGGEDFASGAYFLNAQWDSVVLGANPANVGAWHANQDITDLVCYYPESKIRVDFVSKYHEQTVNIALR